MLQSAIIHEQSDPSLNVNLGCNLKYKPGDYEEESVLGVKILCYLKQKRISED